MGLCRTAEEESAVLAPELFVRNCKLGRSSTQSSKGRDIKCRAPLEAVDGKTFLTTTDFGFALISQSPMLRVVPAGVHLALNYTSG